MRFLMMLAFSSTGFVVQAQDKDSDEKWYKSLDSVKSRSFSILKEKSGWTFNNKWKIIDSSHSGAVYEMPRDRMPCIIPDMKQYTTMPNIGEGMIKKSIDPKIQIEQKQKARPTWISRWDTK